jgi:hypothetical protein
LTPPVLYVRAAVPEDLATLRLWREETAAWLARRYGVDQWSKPFWERRRLALIEQGATVMAMLGTVRPRGGYLHNAAVRQSPVVDAR